MPWLGSRNGVGQSYAAFPVLLRICYLKVNLKRVVRWRFSEDDFDKCIFTVTSSPYRLPTFLPRTVTDSGKKIIFVITTVLYLD